MGLCLFCSQGLSILTYKADCPRKHYQYTREWGSTSLPSMRWMRWFSGDQLARGG